MEGQLKNGTILTSESGNKYEVISLLGAGGQGEVYDVKCGGNHYALKGSSFISSWLRLFSYHCTPRHVFDRSRVQKSSCKRACISFLGLVS